MNIQIQKLLFSHLKALGGSAEVNIRVNGVENKEVIDSVDETSFTITFTSGNSVTMENGTLIYTQNKIPIRITANDISGGVLNTGMKINGSFNLGSLGSIAFGGRTYRKSRRHKRKRSRRTKVNPSNKNKNKK